MIVVDADCLYDNTRDWYTAWLLPSFVGLALGVGAFLVVFVVVCGVLFIVDRL